MKKLCAFPLVLSICLLTFATNLVLRAQAPSPGNAANADIVKLIQAGLPESVILNKIREGARRWDTSVDALITLKKAGATEAELAAMSAPPPLLPHRRLSPHLSR